MEVYSILVGKRYIEIEDKKKRRRRKEDKKK